MMSFVDDEHTPYLAKSLEVRGSIYARAGGLNLVHKECYPKAQELEKQRVVDLQYLMRINCRNSLTQACALLSHADLFTSFLFHIAMMTNVGLRCSKPLALGDSTLKSREASM
ncbi:hypothetical protein QAD02_016088 [Eretmocerus hayati]|uniref:Uncharacterized protein n=1 Tax=Eretmocerus hayati TaxID=131215 RepID=A0ACC2PA10_9HYME|nr:hypothetical protein QAD02_016088 [Eretmocerus hayati]